MPGAHEHPQSLTSLPQKPVSWYLAIRQLHTWLEMDDGSTAHPFVLLLINPELEIILGFDLLPQKPDKEQTLRFLLNIIKNPPKESLQDPHRPKRIVLESQDMALTFRTDLEQADIETDFQAAPPHITQLITDIEDMLAGYEPSPPGLLSIEGVKPALIGELFSAAADFYFAAPWKSISDTQPLRVHFESIDEDAYIQLMGNAGLEFGLVMYWDWDDLLHTYVTADDPLEQVPPGGWRSLTFENADLLPWEDLDATEEYGWKIAGENAYPLVITYTRTSVMRPTRQELILYEALLRAIPEFVSAHLRPYDQGDYATAEGTLVVKTYDGPMTLTLYYPAGEFPEELLEKLTAESGETGFEWDSIDYESDDGFVRLGPPLDPRAMEGYFLNSWDEPDPTLPESDLREAQRLMYRAWEETNPEERIKLAQQALETSSDCADAYILLAEEKAESLEEAHGLYLKGVQAGERALGSDFFEENTGFFWGLVQTRPYMRARYGLMECLALMGHHDQAIQHCRDLLTLNPNDNQGVRYILITLLLHMRLDQEAQELIEQYAEDASADWAYSRALLSFRRHGSSPEARDALKNAIASNAFVPDFLTGRTQLPEEIPDFMIPGDETEAAHYVTDHFSNWWGTSGAIDWLKSYSGASPTKRRNKK
jgi:tetratricopeptide (TPR) repeat protein